MIPVLIPASRVVKIPARFIPPHRKGKAARSTAHRRTIPLLQSRQVQEIRILHLPTQAVAVIPAHPAEAAPPGHREAITAEVAAAAEAAVVAAEAAPGAAVVAAEAAAVVEEAAAVVVHTAPAVAVPGAADNNPIISQS